MAVASIMTLTSPGLRTELFFGQFSGMVTALEDVVLIETPSNPDYFWGNYVIFDRAPAVSDAQLWTDRFDELFKNAGGIKHRSITWDVKGMPSPLPEDVVQAFRKIGYNYESRIYHRTDTLIAPVRLNEKITIRPVSTKEEWLDVLEMQILCWVGDMDEDEFRAFKTLRVQEYERMVLAGKGLWFGAFLDGRLVGDAGIYWDEDFARYQNVETHPDFRKQGICRTLVYEMGKWVLDNGKADHLIIEAAENSDPMRIYQSLGFQPIERVEEFCMYWD